MRDPRSQQGMVTKEECVPRPRHCLPARSATEPLPPDIADGPIEQGFWSLWGIRNTASGRGA